MLLSREQILSAQDITTETVAVPEWGGEVLVRGLTGAQRDEYEESFFTGRGKDRKENFANVRARLVALCIVGEDGKPLFSLKDVEVLGKKSATALDRVFAVAQRLSGIGAKDVEALAGNSETGQSATSTSS
jgi:hypothetical protein